MRIDYPDGATPLIDEEIDKLIPTHITNRDQLNQWEQENIHKAQAWLAGKKKNILTEKNLLTLHKKMFDQTWKWAGQFRTSNKNIGVDKSIIAMELRKLIDDTLFQIEHNTYEFNEIAARFHHRLVQIHLFPNGNGRHARIATDYLLTTHHHKAFTWGKNNIVELSETRKRYITALKKADRGSYDDLFNFVRS